MWQPTLQQSQLHFCTERIMAVLLSLTCATVILSQEITRKCRTVTVKNLSWCLETWKMLKIVFIEAKIYKLPESAIPHKALFQHQLDCVWPTNHHEKLFTQNVTNISFIFEASRNAKPEEKKVGDTAYYVPPGWKSGGTRPPCPPPNFAHDLNYTTPLVITGFEQLSSSICWRVMAGQSLPWNGKLCRFWKVLN